MKQGFLVIAFSLVGFGLLGQGVGIFYTMNGAKLTGDKPIGYRIAYDQGFALGAFVDIRMAKDVELSIQPSYLKIQSKIKIPDQQSVDGGFKDTLDFTVRYISLPLLFKLHPIKSDRFYFIGGPQLGFLLDSKTTNDNGEEQDRGDIMNDLNLSFNFGLGYRIPIRSLYLSIEARYEQGLVNITDFGNPQELLSRTKTQGLNLTVAIGLPFKSVNDE